jgi:tetrahydromethanopterin S-methyltransferase subunit E
MVRIVDNAFEVYTFCMLGTNVPTTVFTLLSFYNSWSTNFYDVVLSVPELLFCVVQITGLTLQPARVFGAIRQVESIIYANYNIWMPFNGKFLTLVFVIANLIA